MSLRLGQPIGERFWPGRLLAFLVALTALSFSRIGAAQTLWYGALEPGSAEAVVEKQRLSVSNGVLEMEWSISEGGLVQTGLSHRLTTGRVRSERDAFVLVFRDGSSIGSSEMKIAGEPRVEELHGNASAARWAAREDGKQIVVALRDEKRGIDVRWRAILRDDSNYLRAEITVAAARKELNISAIRFPGFASTAARVEGTVSGSPVVTEELFFGLEHPMSQCAVEESRSFCTLTRAIPLQPEQELTCSSVLGIFAPGQARRSFLNYLERERAHPYRPFLTYNSWFDIGYENQYDEKDALHVIDRYGQELVRQRHVKLDSFLFDDGWDDPRTLWKFHRGFPDGFRKVRERADSFGARPGIWLSPWGGYDKALEARLKFGKTQGFETNERGFALSGPRYFDRFREVTLGFIREYGVNQFKIDGTGNVNYVFAGSKFDSDFHAAIDLIGEWRRVEPNIFVNLTTGTFPSPFWLEYADSIWRGGEDTGFGGVGSWREKWITYRDAQTFANIVRGGPLFPLNSLMLHGIVLAKKAEHLTNDPQRDFAKEVWSYFGSGTELQEMYITPDSLTPGDWNTLARAATWSRGHTEVLRDTHWVGGDPGKLAVYGWAAWSPGLAILTLRNPSDHTQKAELDLQGAFELPAGATTEWTLTRVDAKRKTPDAPAWHSGRTFAMVLPPFEVVVIEAKPVARP